MRNTKIAATLLLAAFFTGFATGGEGDAPVVKKRKTDDIDERLAGVKREVKVIDLDTALIEVDAVLAREHEHSALVAKMAAAKAAGGEVRPLLEKGFALKREQLQALNRILKLHDSKFRGLTEQQVWDRLNDARFVDVHYRDEWLVNILDDLEEAVGINIEIDARVYKFNTVSFDFEKTSARAMLQMMADALVFKWIVRGDTLYVYRERNEVLFGPEWKRQQKRAKRAREKALREAEKEAHEEAQKAAREQAAGEGETGEKPDGGASGEDK